jgi:2-methylcitrate dehydratase PrpD
MVTNLEALPKLNQDSPEVKLTAQLVQRAAALASAPLQADVQLVAKQCILDWVGVALAGSMEPVTQMLISQCLEEGAKPAVSLIGSAHRVSVRQGALINGVAGHAIDYDDTNVAAQGHVTAAVLPAALALAEAHGRSGEELLRAFAAGYEMACMVGQYLGRAHYERGFHATCTVGSFGAAFAAATLLKLDAQQTAIALGIAGTQAGGQKAQFGTMCKPLHAGKAGENGVMGAQLAVRGFTGCDDLLEASQGFAAATSPSADLQAALCLPPGGSYLYGNLFKYHAACYGTHASIEAVQRLCRTHALEAMDIRRIQLDVESGADQMCNIAAPDTGLQAKFSLRMSAALAASGENTADPAIYVDTMTQRPDLIALRDRIEVKLMPEGWPRMMARADIEMLDGRIFETSYDSGIPESDLALQGRRLEKKFMSLVSRILGEERSAQIAQTIQALESLDHVSELMAQLQNPPK